MTAERFDDAGFDSLCRYALFDGNELLRTNMDDRHLQKALQYERGGTQGGSVLFYTQYYMSAELEDGTRCLCLAFCCWWGSSQDAPTGRRNFWPWRRGG